MLLGGVSDTHKHKRAHKIHSQQHLKNKSDKNGKIQIIEKEDL